MPGEAYIQEAVKRGLIDPYRAEALRRGILKPKQPPETGTWPSLKRAAGLTARHVIEGAGGIVAPAVDVLRGAESFIFPSYKPQRFEQQIASGATAMGLPMTETPTEKAMGAASRFLTGMMVPLPRALTPAPHLPGFTSPVKTAKDLAREGIKLTPGQIGGKFFKGFEEKATAAPILGSQIYKAQEESLKSFNIAALNRVLAPIGKRVPKEIPAGREAIAYVDNEIGRAYDAALKDVIVRQDKFLTTGIDKLVAASSRLDPGKAKQFQSIVEDTVKRRFENGVMDGRRAKESVSEVSRLAANARSDPSSDTREMGRLLTKLKEHLSITIRRQNRTAAEPLKNADAAFRQWVRVENAASRQGAKEGIFTPEQLNAGVRAVDKSLRHREYLKGKAPMQDLTDVAGRVIGNKFPDSGTAARALTTALLEGVISPKILIVDAAAAGLYTGVLRQAVNAFVKTPNRSTADVFIRGAARLGAGGVAATTDRRTDETAR